MSESGYVEGVEREEEGLWEWTGSEKADGGKGSYASGRRWAHQGLNDRALRDEPLRALLDRVLRGPRS